MKNMIFAILISLSAFAVEKTDEKCIFNKSSDPKLTWTAFKTPKKVGVKGTFDAITYNNNGEAKTLKDFLLNALLEIDTTSVKTGDTTRDGKLVSFFFGKMKNKTIKAKIQMVKDKQVVVLLQMNGIKKEVTMDYAFENNMLTLSATLDVLDWNMSKGLDALNKACAALHENKTWSDVNILVEVPATLECNAKI